MWQRPMAVGLVLALAVLPAIGVGASFDPPLPRPRPEASARLDAAPPQPSPPLADVEATPTATLPEVTPTPGMPAEAQVYQSACPALFSGAIEAERLPPIADGLCRADSPLEMTAIRVGDRRVAMSGPAIVDCAIAGQLAEWLARVDAYLQPVLGSEVDTLLVGTSYECRPRNHDAEAKLSEHGRADAVDITGFVLADGTRLILPDDWAGDGAAARAMQFAHDAACGLFTTVLGPDANVLHRDHLHLDLGCHGATCTYRLCQ